MWFFVEKLPVISTLSLSGETQYPQPGVIACQVINLDHDASGREIAEIDTGEPWGVESAGGTTRFQVFADQLAELITQ